MSEVLESGQFDRPVGIIEKLLPALISLMCQMNMESGVSSWLYRFSNEFYAGLSGGSAAFFAVTFRACGNDVFPGNLSAKASRLDMVNRQFLC